jgi:hypothetical protein
MLASICGLLLACPAAPTGPETRKEFAVFDLDATWRLVRVERRDDAFPEADAKRLKKRFDGFTVYTVSIFLVEGHARIVRTGTGPYVMTIRFDNRSEVIACLYEVKGDTARLAFGKDWTKAPQSFEDQDLLILSYEKLKRPSKE